eukprot:jgi/Botrbrau1/19866/Bobra.0676s0002.1
MCLLAKNRVHFDTRSAIILSNLAELTVRSLEKVWVRHQTELREKNQAHDELRRSIECYDRGFLFVQHRNGDWKILHVNAPAATQLCIDMGHEYQLEEIFQVPSGSEDWVARMHRSIVNHRVYVLQNVLLRPPVIYAVFDLIFRFSIAKNMS